MILTGKLLLHYLVVETGLLNYKDYLSAKEVVVTEKVARNRNFTVRVTFGAKFDPPELIFHIKQPINFSNTFVDSGKNEALFYEKIRNNPEFSSSIAFIPFFEAYHPSDNILILQGLKPSFKPLSLLLRPKDTNHINKKINTQEIIQAIAIRLAEIISTYHQVFIATKVDKLESGLPDFKLGFTAETFEKKLLATNSNHKKSIFSSILKNQNLLQAFLDISGNWTRKCLIHNDLSFRNFLFPDGDSYNIFLKEAQLVDWELAAIGDPLWDVSNLFYEMIMLDTRMAIFLPTENISPLPLTHTFLFAFWSSYVSRLGIKVNESTEMITKLFVYTAVRIFEDIFDSVKNDDIDTGALPTSKAIFRKAEDMMLHPLAYANLFLQNQSSYLALT